MASGGVDEIEVYKCLQVAVCQGKRQVFQEGKSAGEITQACTGNSEGLGCGACIAGTYKKSGACVACAGSFPSFSFAMFFGVVSSPYSTQPWRGHRMLLGKPCWKITAREEIVLLGAIKLEACAY